MMAGTSGIAAVVSAIAGKFDPNKHKRGAGGKFAFQGGAKPKPSTGKGSGSVAAAHALFEKMKGKPKKDVLAAAQAIGINPNTAKTQLYHWQKKQATEALAGIKNPTKEQMQQAVASAIGVKGVKAPEPAPAPKAEPKPAPKPAPKPEPTPVTATPKEAPSLEKLGPTKYVHALADHMQGAAAKDVKAAAVKAGVNPSTASVQYSKWKAKQNGVAPQLEKSPEPKPLQAKQPADMSDKELDKAIDSYHGKLNVVPETETFAAKPYKHTEDYYDGQGGKALTAKLKPGDVYTNQSQGKTFYKSNSGRVYEHTGAMGQMKQVAGEPTAAEFHYDPATKIVYAKAGGVLKPISSTTPVFKNNQPYDGGDHALKDHSWSSLNGVHDPAFAYGTGGQSVQQMNALKATLEGSGVKYSRIPAVRSYTGLGYRPINNALRGKEGYTMAAVQDRVDAIDSAISKSSFKSDTVMWRGVGEGGTVWNGAPPPSEVSDAAFASVSFRPDIGKRFSDKKTLFRVKMPKGFPGLSVAINSPMTAAEGLSDEAEVLLPRGTSYKVVARHAGIGPTGAGGKAMDVVDLEPVLPQWYIAKYGQPKLG